MAAFHKCLAGLPDWVPEGLFYCRRTPLLAWLSLEIDRLLCTLPGVKFSGFILGESVNRFFRSNQLSLTQLGPLEQRLLGEIWSRNNATVRELIDYSQLDMAYTTVMTTLDRLFKKGLLDRTEEGRAFRYFPRVTREELQREAAGQAIQQLLGTGPASLPLSYLVEAVTEHDTQLLDELQQLVEKKRRELRDRE